MIAKPSRAAFARWTVCPRIQQNHDGKAVQRTNEGSLAKWRLKEAANCGGLETYPAIGAASVRIATLTLIQYRRGVASTMKSINHRRCLAREALAAELDRRRRWQGVIENAATVKPE